MDDLQGLINNDFSMYNAIHCIHPVQKNDAKALRYRRGQCIFILINSRTPAPYT